MLTGVCRWGSDVSEIESVKHTTVGGAQGRVTYVVCDERHMLDQMLQRTGDIVLILHPSTPDILDSGFKAA